MRKTKMKVIVWMFIVVLMLSIPRVQAYAEAESGITVSLPHIHAGSADSGGGCYTTPVYHSHTGSSSSGDGCYTVPVLCGGSITAKTGETYCGDWNVWYGPNAGHTESKWWASCTSCGTLQGPHDNNDFGTHHMRQETYYSCDKCGTQYGGSGTCAKTAGYSTGCGKNDAIESYKVGCGYAVCGSAYIINQDTAFTKETSLACEIFSAEAGCEVIGYTWSNGASGQTITVKENGTYTCNVAYVDVSSGKSGSAAVSIKVSNIDNQGPNISANQMPAEWTKESVQLKATAEDGQSGLPESAYSWDGIEWLSTAERSVTENGSYTLKVRDRLGNQSEYTFTVSNIDREAPVIASWQLSNEEYTDQPVTLTVTASDSGSGLADQAYSIDGEHWQSESAFVIDQSGTYNIYVRDRLGNSTSLGDQGKLIEITNIDTQAPTLSGKQTPESWTNGTVLLAAIAEDKQSGLPENAYSWDEGEWSSAAECSVTENGSYTLRVRDRVGNQSEYIFTVSNIDKERPVIESWTVSTEALTREPVKIVVQAGDYESGLAKQAYSLDGEHWQSENIFMINENGTYNIYVRDKAGNVTSLADEDKAIVVSNIKKMEPDQERSEEPTPVPTPTPPAQEMDSRLPVVELTLESQGWWPDGKNKIIVTVHDTGSGLAQEPYSYDSGRTWTDIAEYEITESGVYVVLVRDAAGNITESAIEAVKMELMTESETGETEGITIIPPVVLMPRADRNDDLVQDINQDGMDYEWITMKDQSVGTETGQPEDERPIVHIDDQETPENGTIPRSGIEVAKITAAVAGTVASGGIFIFFVWFCGTWIPVYAQTTAGKYERIGRVGLRRRKEIYQIRMGRMMLNRAETNMYKLKFRKQFAKKHGSELLRVESMAHETYTDLAIDEEVTFQI